MKVKEAKEILGDKAIWELINMRSALSLCSILNSEEENKRLEAVNVLLNEVGR